ncbi:hypothetical protein [Salinigranum halophilum]|jgi:hypothetical protein|uniref:hypothetical protein n=1 Tax=Salinigranum halophilum TaxID=2565931 RepID=UPI00115E70D4|nr:hypothetical protein [Salinigranum halophilum]
MDTQSTRETKDALSAFVAGPQESAEQVIDEATASLDSVGTAARFLADDGERRLAEAVVRAVRDDDWEAVDRGRETLETLRELTAALAGEAAGREGSWSDE